MKISTLSFNDHNMPIATIEYNDGSVGYLSPFRAYKFQVSKTFDGQYDMGSSEVVGLRNIVEGFDFPNKNSNYTGYASNVNLIGFVKEMLKGQAMLALMKSNRKGEPFDMGKFDRVELSNGESVFINNDLDEYIEEVYIYLTK